jgi:hypothetical protein
MQVQVKHSLSGGGVRIEDEPEAVFGAANLARKPSRGLHELANQRLILGTNRECARDVFARNQLYVRRRLRMDVREGDDALILVHDSRRQLSRGDSTEQTVTSHYNLARADE